MPWSDYREWAYGVLNWDEASFGGRTLRHLFDGLEGWRKANRPSSGMSATRLEELKDLYPDG